MIGWVLWEVKVVDWLFDLIKVVYVNIGLGIVGKDKIRFFFELYKIFFMYVNILGN